MSKKLFSDKEINLLASNPNVSSVSSKGITYTVAFKQLFIIENQKGKSPRQIFEENGFDVDILGITRVESSGNRWRKAYREDVISGLRDTRAESSGRPIERELTLEEKYARLEAKHRLLQAENELLKKIRLLERGE